MNYIRKIAKVLSEDIHDNNGFLLETKCPYCGTEGAYQGFTTVECPNPNCGHYKPSKSTGAHSRLPDHFDAIMKSHSFGGAKKIKLKVDEYQPADPDVGIDYEGFWVFDEDGNEYFVDIPSGSVYKSEEGDLVGVVPSIKGQPQPDFRYQSI